MWWLNIYILAGLLALEVLHWIASTFSAAVHLVAPPDRQRQRVNIVFCPLMMVEVCAPDMRSPRRSGGRRRRADGLVKGGGPMAVRK